MRLFFALDPPAQLQLAIADWRDRQFGAVGRAVPVANLHITLAFLGELPQSRLEQLLQNVDRWLDEDHHTADSLRLDDTGYWPRPGLYWLGPSQWPSGLDHLAGGLAGICQQLGGRRERRRYQPHLTLYRRCETAPPRPAAAPDFLFRYEHFTLFESRRGRRGATYQGLAHWELG